MPQKTLTIPKILYRAGVAQKSEDGKTIRISISSDEPYLRYDWMSDEDYWEVLDHTPQGCDMSRLQNGAALLFNHKRDVLLGLLNNPSLEGGRCYVDARISEAADVASYKTKVDEGILKDTSVGYEIVGDGICIGAKEEKPIYKFRFATHEASLVTIPADITVGVGRQRAKDESAKLIEISIREKETVDTPQKSNTTRTNPMADPIAPAAEPKPQVDIAAERKAALTEFKGRCKKIDEHTAAIKNESWRKAVEIVANKHKDGDANFEEFRSEANNAISELQSKDQKDIEDDPERSRIEVIGERGGNTRKSIGQRFVAMKEFRDCGGHIARGRTIGFDTGISILGARGKAALMSRAGFTSSDLSAVNVQIQQGVIGLGVQRLTIMDLIAPGSTGAASIIYPRENSFGTINGVATGSPSTGVMPKAETVGERGVKPKWDPDLTTETATVKKVAVVTDVPDEFLADFPAAQSYIDERLPYMVDTKTEEQILYGDGTGNNLKGIFTNAGVQTRAITTTDDSTKAASLRQGLTDISVGSMFEPDGYAFHPYDWETAQLLKDDNKRFLAGGPYYVPYTNGVFIELHTFWGKPVVVSTAVTYGQPLAGAWKLGAQYFLREGMRIEMSNSNKDNFERNMITVRAEHRLALATYRPPAFLEFTGFPARA